MSKRRGIMLAFALVVLAQLAVPAWIIIDRELTLLWGTTIKFKTMPVDPVDPFRGRYVMLRLEPESVVVPSVKGWKHYEKTYAVLGIDPHGFAEVKRIESEPPEGQWALPVRVSWWEQDTRTVHLQWTGLDRYYMTEQKAPQAESAYRTHSVRTNQACHVAVKVRGTRGVIENLFIEDQPIQDWLRAQSKAYGSREK